LCDDCHDAYTINTGGGSVVLSSANMNNWEYVPGQTYNMTLTVARSGSPLFGLGLEALDASNANAGTLTITDAASSQIKTKLVGTAPATDIGPVTFYYAGVASNADGDEAIGDYVYNGVQVVTPANTTGIGQASARNSFCFPNPASSQLSVRVQGTTIVRLIDTEGRTVRSIRQQQAGTRQLEKVILQ
jgi:ethanolamine utilization microcompartment shell protein EutS